MDKFRLHYSRQIAGVMWKTVSEACNLACDYCYYSRCKGRPGKINRIRDDLLEKFIREYLEIKIGYAPFYWQGGEPLLAGLEFFQQVVDLQKRYSGPGTYVVNAIQTNGTLIDAQWAEFFKTHNFLVGVSLDGPKEIHDERRLTGSGKGSYQMVMRGVEYLKKAGVNFNILTVIHEKNVDKGKEIMRFFLEENFTHVQFIPCMDFTSQNPGRPTKYAISPEQYGKFLCEIFDIWYNNGNPKISIRFFDNMLAAYVNQIPEMCQLQKTCPKLLVLEPDGKAYPCDFYMNEDYLLGNMYETSLIEILESPKWKDFLSLKPALSKDCQTCEFIHLCNGGCPRNRVGSGNAAEKEYFCKSYKQIFRYSQEKMTKLAMRVMGEAQKV